MVLSNARRSEFDRIGQAIRSWASESVDVVGVLLVGSWARNAARMDSDIDVVVLTESERFVADEEWIAEAVGQSGDLIRTGDWGALIERRVRLRSGLEIEFGFVKPSWATIDPVAPGTSRVVTDGCQIWHDPDGQLAQLIATAN